MHYLEFPMWQQNELAKSYHAMEFYVTSYMLYVMTTTASLMLAM